MCFSPCVTYNKKQHLSVVQGTRLQAGRRESTTLRILKWRWPGPKNGEPGCLSACSIRNERQTYEEGEPAMVNGAMSKLPYKPLDASILLEFV